VFQLARATSERPDSEKDLDDIRFVRGDSEVTGKSGVGCPKPQPTKPNVGVVTILWLARLLSREIIFITAGLFRPPYVWSH